MIDPTNVPNVAPDEWLARFVLYSRHVRTSDQTVKSDAFIPHPHQELSVTRHLSATDDEIWGVGEQVATQQSRTLYGRADVEAQVFTSQSLNVQASPVLGNPNHADVAGWPTEKPRQKMIAIQIAAVATYRGRP